jgi:hypothetical protein
MRNISEALAESRQSKTDRKNFDVDASPVEPAFWRELIAHRNYLANRENAAAALRPGQVTLRSAKVEHLK